MRDVLVIGAGPAGLAAAGRLRRRDIDVAVLERGSSVGTSWRRRHDHLRLNTHRWFSHLPGLRIDRKAGRLPSRDGFVAHLEEYVRRFQIPVEYDTDVRRLDLSGESTWDIEVNGDTYRCRHVVVATGSDLVPNEISWPGVESFAGRVIHASDFRNVADHAGEDVLVVGGGNSGFDVMNHLCRSDAGQLWLSVRSGATVLPLTVLGQPLHPVAVVNRRMPAALQDPLTSALSKLLIGDLSRHGLPRAKEGTLARFNRDRVSPPLDDGTAAAIKAKRVMVVPVVDRFEGRDVVLADGSRLQPTTVICATGYRPGLESLVGHLVDLDEHGLPPAYGGRPTPGYPGLWFLGINSEFTGNMHARISESRRLDRALRSELAATGS